MKLPGKRSNIISALFSGVAAGPFRLIFPVTPTAFVAYTFSALLLAFPAFAFMAGIFAIGATGSGVGFVPAVHDIWFG